MKTLITIISILISTLAFSQTEVEKEAFKYINTYRVNHGKEVLTWSNKIYKKAKKHTEDLMDSNKGKDVITVYHSGFGNENVALFYTNDGKIFDNDFFNFINKEFGIKKSDINDVNLPGLLAVYCWDGSPKHKEGMLSNKLEGSVSLGTQVHKMTNSGFSIDVDQWFATMNWK